MQDYLLGGSLYYPKYRSPELLSIMHTSVLPPNKPCSLSFRRAPLLSSTKSQASWRRHFLFNWNTFAWLEEELAFGSSSILPEFWNTGLGGVVSSANLSPATHPWPFNFILPELTRGWEGLFLVPQLAQGSHLLFPRMHWGLCNLLLPGLAQGEEDFLWCLYFAQGLHLLFPRMHWGLCNLLLPGLAQGEEDFLGCLYFAQGLHLLFPRMHWGLCNLFLPELTRGWEGLSLFLPTLAWGEKVFLNRFSPDSDENWKLYTRASNRQMAMRT